MSDEITLEGLLPSSAHRHYVHALGCPASLTGLALAVRSSLAYLRSAANVRATVPYAQWAESVDQLHDLLVEAADLQPSLLSTSAEDATKAPYCDFLKPLRSVLPNAVVRTVEAELARTLLTYTSNGMPFPRALMHGFVCMLKSGRSLSPSAAAWRRLAENFPLTRDAIKAAQGAAQRSDVKSFLAALTRSHGLELRSPSDLEPRSHGRNGARASDEDQTKEATGPREASDFGFDGDDDEEEPKFEGSFLGWLVKAGQRTENRHRFGVEGQWDRLTLDELRHVCAKIRQALRTPGPNRAYAYLAQISLLTSLPADLAIRIPIGPNDDLFLLDDLRAIGWHWPRVLKRKRGKASAGSAIDHSGDVLVPQSEDAFAAGRDLLSRHPHARSLAELLLGTDEDWAVDDFLQGFQKWLTSLGQGWLHGVRWARFAKSFSHLYRSQASDIVAAILGLNFREVAMGTLHYVALPASYIDEQVGLAYERVGWGRPVQLRRTSAVVGSQHALSIDRFVEALSRLALACEKTRAHMLAATAPASLVAHFNELVHLRQLQAITLMAGRGNRISGLTWYALYGHADYVMLGDKNTDYYSFFRLIPVYRHLLDSLGQYIADVDAFVNAARKFQLVTVDVEQRCPTSPAFVTAHLKRAGAALLVRSGPTERRRLKELAKCHLHGPINTGRHSILSLAALEGVDSWLIKTLSGHRRGTAEPFADGGVVSPRHALQLLRSALDWMLRKVPTAASAADVDGRFVVPLSGLSDRVPSPTVRAGRGRPWLTRVLGPPCDRHTITALRVIEQIRRLLVAGKGPARADADLLLCAMVLDWVERTDLQEWWRQLPFRSLPGGVPIAAWQRKNKPGEVIRTMEAPAALALLRVQHELNGRLPAWTDTCDAVASWVRAAVAGVRWPQRSETLVNVLDALMRRWVRIQAPPFILAAASVRLASATANRASILRLAGEPPPTTDSGEPLPSMESPDRTPRRARAAPSVMADIMSRIHEFGSTDKRKGEDKARWEALSRAVQSIDCSRDSRARALREWIEREDRLWRWDPRLNAAPLDDDADLLQVNSASRYVTYLTSGLERILPSETIENWGEDEWYEWVDVLIATTRGDKVENRLERARRTLVAAHRFLRALALRGYPIPASLLKGSDTGEIDSIRRAAAATLLLRADRARILDRISAHFGDIPIVGELARLYVLLLFAAPLRSTECAVLPLNGLSLFDALVIASGGWSHLKSKHAKRLIPIVASIAEEIRAVAALLASGLKARRASKANERHWFFLPGGEDDWSLVRILSSTFVTVMRQATGDPDARLHSTRTVAPLDELLGDWEPELRALLDGSATTAQCHAYCARIQAAGFVHLLRVILHTGHGHPHTYVEYYFPLWPLLLSLFARAALSGLDAPGSMLHRHPPEASAALLDAQSRARDAGRPLDTWGWMADYAGVGLDLRPLQQNEPRE